MFHSFDIFPQHIHFKRFYMYFQSDLNDSIEISIKSFKFHTLIGRLISANHTHTHIFGHLSTNSSLTCQVSSNPSIMSSTTVSKSVPTALFLQARSYIFIFYLLGQNSYNPRLSSIQTKWSRFVNFLPSILSILTNFILTIVGITYRYNYEDFYEQTDSVVTYILMSLQFTTNLVMMLQSIRYASKVCIIYEKMELVRKQTADNLRFTIEFEPFERRYRRNLFLIGIIYTVTVIIKFIFPSTKTHIVVQTVQILQLAYTLTDNLHALFYIELLVHFLQATTRCVHGYANHIEHRRIYYPTIRMYEQGMALANLRYIKRIYYQLFDISLLINKRFGWSLVALFVMNFVELAYSSYWVFLYLNAYHSHLFISNNIYTCIINIIIRLYNIIIIIIYKYKLSKIDG